MRRVWGALLALLLCGLHSLCVAAPMQFVLNGPETRDDQRYNYHRSVLVAALEATRSDYGDYALYTSNFMNESRQVAEMHRDGGLINTLVLDATVDLMRDLLPVRIPIDKGLLGYRLFLIRAEDQPRFSTVRTLDDLRKFSIGQGADWSDVAIYRAAGFQVVGGASYDGLFDMLMGKRFDAFGRGATEVIDEWSARRHSHADMAIERDLLLYYPMPVYFWFPKTEQGQRMVRRIGAGMERLVANGALDRMFRAEFGSLIERLQLKRRRLLRIPNPNLPLGEPFGDKRLWFDPLK